MFDPLAQLKAQVADIEKRVRVAVEIAILRETVRFQLSRLMTLDPDNAQYKSALDSIGE